MKTDDLFEKDPLSWNLEDVDFQEGIRRLREAVLKQRRLRQKVAQEELEK